MTTNFPSALDNFNNPTPANNLDDPAVLHTDQHSNANDAIEAIEAWVGISGTSEQASHEYRIKQLENTPAGAGQFGIVGWDEGIFVGTGSVLNVVGDNVVLSRSGTVLNLLHTNPPFPQSQIGIYGQDEAVGQGTGTILNLRGNTSQLTVSGTVIDIFISGSTQYDIFGGMSLSALELQDADFFGILDSSDSFFVAKIGYSQIKQSLRLVFNREYQGSGTVLKVQDEGIPLGTAYTLNAVGERVSASLSGTVLNLDISPDPQELIGIYGQNNGINIGTGTILNVTGDNVSFSLSGSVLNLHHTNPSFPQDGIGIMGQDEGIPLGTGSTLNVVGNNISLSISGSVLQLTHTDTPVTFPQDNIGVFGRNQGNNLGTGTIIDWGIGMNAAITGTTLFVHPFDGGAHGQVWKYDTGSTQGASWGDDKVFYQFYLGDGVSVIPSGTTNAGQHYVGVFSSCVIDDWVLLADQAGTITLDVLKSTYAGFPPSTPLAGLGQPKLTAQQKAFASATGTVNLAFGDILLVRVPTVPTSVKSASLFLRGRKT